MTPFEFVFALISIITSLALTQIIAGVVAIVRNKDRAGLSLAHALWVWIGFALVVGNWGVLWAERIEPDWPAYRVLARLASMTSLYAFCALVIPDVERGAPLDLKEFHAREGRRYILAHNLFALIAILLLLMVIGPTAAPMLNLGSAIVAFGLGTLALLTRGRLQLVASILVAILATAFMVANIDILSD